MSSFQLILGAAIILLIILLILSLRPKPKKTVYIICIDLWNCDGAYIKNDIGAKFNSYEDAEKWAKKHISGGYYIMTK
jgi:hypothetical protein